MSVSSQSKFFVKKISIVRKDTGQEIKLNMSNVKELRIYESLTFPGITGEIDLIDWYDLSRHFEISVGDKFIFQFNTEDGKILTLEYIIYASKNNIIVENNYTIATKYQFCSKWLIDGFGTQYSNFYDNKYIHQIVQDIVEKNGGSFKEIEPTHVKYEHFVTPLWSPIHSLKYLLTYAQSKDKKYPAYMLYSDLPTDKLIFKPMTKILKDSASNYNPEQPFVIRSKNVKYKNRVYKYDIEENFDLMQFLNKGYYKQEILEFDENYKKIHTIKDDINETKAFHLSKYMPYPEDYYNDKYKTISTTWLYPNRRFVPTNRCYDDMIDGYQKTLYTHLFSDFVKINAMVNGDSTRRVGDIVRVNIPAIKDFKTQINELLSGAYLIRNILHVIIGNEYLQYITFVSDGYKILNRNDKKEWNINEGVLI